MPSALLKIARNSSFNGIMDKQSPVTTGHRAAGQHSFTLPHLGDDYRVDIYVPAGEAPAGGWPAMLLLDAETCFMTAVEALRRMSRRPDATGVQPMVLIGLSAPGRDPQLRHRERDFGSRDEASPFADFVELEVLEKVTAETPVNIAHLTLFGHSLGGYFALWVLAHRPHLFASIAAISPSIWWDRSNLREALAQISQNGHHILICVGGWEDDLPPWQAAHSDQHGVRERRAQRQMVASARDMSEMLSARLGDGAVQFRLLAEEDHASIQSAAIPRALRLGSRTVTPASD